MLLRINFADLRTIEATTKTSPGKVAVFNTTTYAEIAVRINHVKDNKVYKLCDLISEIIEKFNF